jgi:hypothetical protein
MRRRRVLTLRRKKKNAVQEDAIQEEAEAEAMFEFLQKKVVVLLAMTGPLVPLVAMGPLLAPRAQN